MDKAPGTPGWWLDTLTAQLDARAKRIAAMEDWFCGRHPLPKVANTSDIAEAERAYYALLESSVTNFLSFVASAPVDRLGIIGFRFGEETGGDADMWRIWQENHLDADQAMWFDTALQTGQSFALVWPDRDTGRAVITGEYPSQCIVSYAPGSQRARTAGLKRWRLDDGTWHANVYLPDGIYKFTSPGTMLDTPWDWRPRQDRNDDTWPVANPWGVVPLVEIRANPSLRPAPFGGGTPEFEQVIPIQRRINRTVFSRLVMQEFQSFRQRWATGMEPPLDPETGQPINPFKPGAQNLWMAASSDAHFGDFSQGDMAPLLASIEADLTHMMAITKTPPYFATGQLINLAADFLAKLESGFVAKIRRHQGNFGESIEEVLRLALLVTNDPRSADQQTQVLWADAEQRTMAQIVDPLVKLSTLGVPNEALWAMIPGVTPQDINRWKTMQQSQLLRQTIGTFPPVPAGDGSA